MRSFRPIFALAAVLLAVAACASDEPPKDPDLADEESGGDDASEASDLESKGDGEKESEGDSSQGEKADEQAVNDDGYGYDDDWNNVGSQEPKEQQQEQKTEPQEEEEEEPALANAPQNNPPPEPEPAPEPEPVVEEPPVDPEPAPIAEEPPPPPPPAPPPPPPAQEGELPPITSGPPLVKQDVKPLFASLIWVGYDHVERDGVGRVEMVTRGSPRFNVFQERNQKDQPELVVRFFQTALRVKLKRDIDASEFRSPVAFIRMRPDEEENHVDVIITLRDAVQPRMYSKNGDVMLSFPLPDHYFGNNTIGDAPVAKAEVLPNSNVMPYVDDGSDLSEGMKVAKAFTSNPGDDAFKNAPPDGGEPVEPEAPPEAPPEATTPDGLPPDFSTPPEQGVPPADAPLVSNAQGAQGQLGGDQFAGNGQGTEDQGVNEEENVDDIGFGGNGSELDGEPPAAGDGFDGNVPPEGDPAQQALPAEEVEGGQQEESDETESLDEDTLEDFDDGEGESTSQIEKFDVRLRKLLPHIAALMIAPGAFGQAAASTSASAHVGDDAWQAFSVAGVAQDDLGLEEGGGDDLGGGDDFGGGGNQTGGNQTGGNQTGGNQTGGNQTGGNNLGGGNQTGGNNFGGGNQTGGNNLLGGGNNTGNAAPATNSAFGNGNTTGANAAAGANAAPVNAGVANAAPVQATQAVDTGDGAAAGEPPVDGQPDLAGDEQTGAESEAAPQPSSGGRPIKLDFRGAPLTEVIRMLGDESGVNFIFPPDIGAKQIYVNLNGVPFNDALKALLEANALGMVEAGPNIVRIDTLERLAADKEAEEKRKKAEIKLRPTKVLIYRLSYAKVEDAQKMLTEMLGAAAREDDRISVQLDVRTNSIIVNAPPNDLAMVKALLERIDLETPQVKIASRIVEVQKKFQEIFGVSWTPTFNFDQGRGLGFGNLAFPHSVNSRFAVDAGGNAANAGTLGLRIGSINNATTLDLALAMEESRSTVEILQSSNLIVEDNAEAEIVAGSSDFFRFNTRAAAGGGEDIAEVTYNLTMKVKPHITADGAVQMKVTLESDTPAQPQSQNGGAIAAKNNRGVTTSLLRKSGETAVIGGIYNTQKSKGNGGVPGLMSIPIIGALFRSANELEEKRELLVMVTPTILSGGKAVAGDGGGGDAAGEGEIAANVQNINDDSGGGGGGGGGGQANFNFDQGNQGGGQNAGFDGDEGQGGLNQGGQQQGGQQQGGQQQQGSDQEEPAEDQGETAEQEE
jgi:type IV pilus assembly protein PilQ